MKAIVIHRFGAPEVLSYEEVPDPLPRAGEIRIKVHAATVNRVLDVSLRAGKEAHRGAQLPLIPGVDCAGIIDAVGPGITRWKVGIYHRRIGIKGMPGHQAADRAKCFAAAAQGKIKAHFERLLPLAQAAQAHRLVESGEVRGKIVLDPTRER